MVTITEAKLMLDEAIGRLGWVEQTLKAIEKVKVRNKESESWILSLEARRRTLQLLVIELSAECESPSISDFTGDAADMVERGWRL